MSKIIKSLENNNRLQYLNLSWNEINESVDLKPLANFIRNNYNLLHLDLSNAFSNVKQIQCVIKAVKHSNSLQSLHFNSAPLIWKSQPLLSYIQRKLNATINK